MKKPNFNVISHAFCRELSLMKSQDFAKMYAFLYLMFLEDRRYPFWYRYIVLFLNGYPFVSKKKAMVSMVDRLLYNIPRSNMSNLLIESVGRMATYYDILAAVAFIYAETGHNFSFHFSQALNDYMNEVDEYIEYAK